MATLWIREYNEAGYARSLRLPVPREPGVADQTPVTFSGSVQSAAFNDATTYIGIIASAAFHYVVADNPTATTSHLKVPADTLHHIGVKPGQKLAAIAAA